MTTLAPAPARSRCILCQAEDTRLVERIAVAELRRLWADRLAIDITDELCEEPCDVDLYRCERCALEYFPPALAGSDRLYERLQAFDWYYMPEKWEHGVALEDIPSGARVLEVGCATGSFVRRLAALPGVNARGIELNGAAVTEARRMGLNVTEEPLAELVAREPASFDVVCSFQVLEHVPDPRAFLAESVALLKPGGRLIFCVPHADSFIRRERNPLDMPPHHVTRWTREAIHSLELLFGLSTVRIVEEPLAPYHVMGYLAANLRRLRSVPGGVLIANPVVYRVAAAAIRLTGVNRRMQGQSIYACLQRA